MTAPKIVDSLTLWSLPITTWLAVRCPLSATTLPPTAIETRTNQENIIKTSRGKYGIRLELTEEKIYR